MRPMTGPRPSTSRPARFVFWMAALLALPNLNHASNLVVGTGWPFTVALSLCCVFLCLVVRVPARWALGVPGFLITTALAFYLVIGVSVLFLTGEGLHTADYTMPARPGLAVLIIVGAAAGATAMLRGVEVESLLKGILSILVATCVTILLTPWLDQYYSFSPSNLTVVWSARQDSRFIGFFTDPNSASVIACYTVAVALSLLRGGRYRMFAGPAVLLGSVAAFLTFSRTGFVTLALVFLFFLGMSMSRLHLRRIFSGWLVPMIILVSGAFALTIANLDYLSEHFVLQKKHFERLHLGDSFVDFSVSRWALWSIGLSQIAESPIFGHGISHFHHLKYAPTCQVTDIVCGVHNTYLMLWGEAGILPPALLLLFIGSLLRRWWTLPESVGANAAASCILVTAVWCIVKDDILYLIGNCFIIGVSCAVMAHAARVSRGPRPGRTRPAPPASVRTAAGGGAPSGAG